MSSEKCNFSQEDSRDAFWYIGYFLVCVVLFKITRSLWRGLYTCILADLLGKTVDWKKLPKWAVVTGATDGIGKAFAKQLAAKGFNIVLISRNPAKLEAVAEEIANKYSVQTKTITVDFFDDVTIYDKIQKEIEGLEIGVLVNNVGMSYVHAEYLTKVLDVQKFSDELIKANINSCVKMTILVLPQMEMRKSGVIINMSSISALSPSPLLSMYSAAKIFVNYFSKATQDEYKKKGVIIQSVLPGFVSTKMSKLRPSLITCTPDACVKWVLRSVGVENQTFGYPVHKVMGYGMEFINTYFPESISLTLNHRNLNSIRLAYYKKHGIVDPEKKTSAKHK